MWRTEQRRVGDLVPYEFNPRVLTEEKKAKLTASLEKFSLAEIPAVNTDNVIVAGHQRIKCLLELGWVDEVIDVRVPSRPLTELEFKEYNLTSNIPAGFFDIDLLESAFGDVDLEALGLNVNELALPNPTPEELGLDTEEEQDFDPTPPEEPVSNPGDVYELISIKKGLAHRVLCGDSTLVESWTDILVPSGGAHLLVTDPPYNVDYTGGTDKKLKIENDAMSPEQFRTFLWTFYEAVAAVMAPGASAYVFHADSAWEAFRKGFLDAGFKLAQCLVWVKNSFVMGRQDYHWRHEPILYGWLKNGPHRWFGDRKQSTVLEFDKPRRNEDHPTMKPVELIRDLIENSSRYKERVLDGFLGSGSTLIASEQALRQCCGAELDARYADVIVRRWVKYMRDNGLEFEVIRNGEALTAENLVEYEQ